LRCGEIIGKPRAGGKGNKTTGKKISDQGRDGGERKNLNEETKHVGRRRTRRGKSSGGGEETG